MRKNINGKEGQRGILMFGIFRSIRALQNEGPFPPLPIGGGRNTPDLRGKKGFKSGGVTQTQCKIVYQRLEKDTGWGLIVKASGGILYN